MSEPWKITDAGGSFDPPEAPEPEDHSPDDPPRPTLPPSDLEIQRTTEDARLEYADYLARASGEMTTDEAMGQQFDRFKKREEGLWSSTIPNPEDSPIEARTQEMTGWSASYRLEWDGQNWTWANQDASEVFRNWDDTQWRKISPKELERRAEAERIAYADDCHQIRCITGEIVAAVNGWAPMTASNPEDARNARDLLGDLDALQRRHFGPDAP